MGLHRARSMKPSDGPHVQRGTRALRLPWVSLPGLTRQSSFSAAILDRRVKPGDDKGGVSGRTPRTTAGSRVQRSRPCLLIHDVKQRCPFRAILSNVGICSGMSRAGEVEAAPIRRCSAWHGVDGKSGVGPARDAGLPRRLRDAARGPRRTSRRPDRPGRGDARRDSGRSGAPSP
jgi:hypothetical protein